MASRQMSPVKKGKPTLFKVVAVGKSEVGKSSFLRRIFHNSFSKDMLPTYGISVMKRRQVVEGETVVVQFWDPSSRNCTPALLSTLFEEADAVFLVYDCTIRKTFVELEHWLELARKCIRCNTLFFIVGTKCDKGSVVSFEKVEAFAQTAYAPWFETSAKDGYGVEEAFLSLVRALVGRRASRPMRSTPSDTSLFGSSTSSSVLSDASSKSSSWSKMYSSPSSPSSSRTTVNSIINKFSKLLNKPK